MIDLKYSLVIECTEARDCYGFHSPDLEGFSGMGCSVEDCIAKAKAGMAEHVRILAECGRPTPPENPHPTIVIHNERVTAET